jgi:uncharacterized protein YydD (DUF2326 family)
MKLSQLYSNKKFKNIKFNDGLNLILAKVTKKLDLNKDSHNLGKTTLITVIDFMLLKEINNTHIFVEHHAQFEGYVFYLEIMLNDGRFLTICRSTDAPTKIGLKETDASTNLLNEEGWDMYPIAKAKERLNSRLGFDVLPGWDFRKSVNYFLRSQKDYNDVFQLEKFKISKHVNWKPLLFDLLGFEGQLLTDKYAIDEEIDDQKKFINRTKRQYAVDTDEVDKIRGAIELKRAEQQDLQIQIDNFNFYQQERNLNKDLIEDIERTISELNSIEYNLEYDLGKAKESLANRISFDVDQLKTIYEDVQVFFPDNLVKGYRDLEEFNKRITEERNKYLETKITELTKQLKQVRVDLQKYDERRTVTLSVLQDKDSFKKFKAYQIDLTKIEGEVIRLEEKLASIDRIGLLTEQTKKLTEKLEELVRKISSQIKSSDNKVYPEIRRLFHNIFRYIFNTPALVYIGVNNNGNIEFKVEVTRENEIDITAESKGNTYQKMLCISFDLAVLVAYHKQSFYRFVYHDGALEGLDNRKKANFIALIREYCTKYNLQYIFTSIQDDIPADIFKAFRPEEICMTLDDSGDSGKLFEFSF